MSPPQVADALARAHRAGTMLAASEVLVRTSPLNRPGRYIDAHFKARPNDHPSVSGDGVDAVPHPGHVLYAL